MSGASGLDIAATSSPEGGAPCGDAYCTSVSVQPKTHGLAIASLVCGITSVVFMMGFLSGIPAALLGHLALERIRESGGAFAGVRLAKAGLVLGYGASVASILAWVTWLLMTA